MNRLTSTKPITRGVSAITYISKSSKQDSLKRVNQGLFNIITESEYHLKSSGEEDIKTLIKFIMTGGDNNLPHEFKQFEDDIVKLRTNRGGWLTEKVVTKSMIDLVAHLYIISSIKKIKDSLGKETINLASLKNIFSNSVGDYWHSGFANNFKYYLETIGINVSAIPRGYINSIKYKEGGYIEFNHYLLDLKDDSAIIKNLHVRDIEILKEQIKAKKIDAVKHYETIIKQIKVIKNSKIKKIAIAQLSIINRTIDLTMRNIVDSRMNMRDLLELAKPFFEILEIQDLKEQRKFIESTIYIHYRQNNGISLKRFFKGIVLVGASVALGMSLGSMILTAFTVAKGVTAMLSLAIIFAGPVVEGIHDLIGFGGEVVGGLRRFLNAGDRINSNTASAEKNYSQLNDLYNKANSDIAGALYEKLPLSEVIPKKDRLRELIELNINSKEKIKILNNTMVNILNKAPHIRDVSLQNEQFENLVVVKVIKAGVYSIYTGQVDENGKPDGYGKIEWTDTNDSYKGNFKHGDMHGEGCLIKNRKRYKVQYNSGTCIKEEFVA